MALKFSAWAIAWLAVVCGWCLQARADPPRVVKTVPEADAKDVEPGTKEIRITFDQVMDSGAGYSIVGGGPQFPKILGRPRWENDHTLVLRVKLEPEHAYRLSVNSDKFTNCRGKNGEPADPFPLAFKTGKAVDKGRPTTRPTTAAESMLSVEENRQAVQVLRQAIDEDYSYRDLKHVDWDKQFAELTPKLESAKTSLQFARIVAKLLEPADDLHLSIEAEGEVFYPWNGKVPAANFNLKTLTRIVPGWTEHGEIVATGRYPSGPLYLLIRLWDSRRAEDLRVAIDAIAQADAAKGLIIDVRPNGGGNELMARHFAGCFVDRPRVYSKDELRSGGQFQGPYDRVVEPNHDGPHYRGKIAVLMGPRCVSSNESFLLMMKTVGDCRLIGAASRGASGRPQAVRLPNEVVVNLPSWRDELPDGTCFEGIGIPPDVRVSTVPSDFDAADPVLEAALHYLGKG